MYHSVAESLLAREIDDEFSASSLTLAEVLVGPVRAERLDAAVTALMLAEAVSDLRNELSGGGS